MDWLLLRSCLPVCVVSLCVFIASDAVTVLVGYPLSTSLASDLLIHPVHTCAFPLLADLSHHSQPNARQGASSIGGSRPPAPRSSSCSSTLLRLLGYDTCCPTLLPVPPTTTPGPFLRSRQPRVAGTGHDDGVVERWLALPQDSATTAAAA